MDMKTRKYDMSTRQEAKDATREAIIAATIETFMAERRFAVTLPAVADRAGITVKTVLRHFGNREILIDAAWLRLFDDIKAERVPPPDDPIEAMDVLLAHYERRGDMVLTTLAQEETDHRAKRMSDAGRAGHRVWVENVFGDRLPDCRAERDRMLDVLVVATDVYAWKLLRRDRGLSVEDVRDRMLLMVEAVLAIAERRRNGRVAR
jgi:AcrR family transcriptional regulator